MANIAILGQMGGSNGFAAAGYHLIGGASLRELGVEFAAEFTRPAGAGVEATDDGWINVFHGERLLAGENGFALDMRRSHGTPPRDE
jgi:hypothetical protein